MALFDKPHILILSQSFDLSYNGTVPKVAVRDPSRAQQQLAEEGRSLPW